MTQQAWAPAPQQYGQQQQAWGGQQQQGPTAVPMQSGDEFDDFFDRAGKGAPTFYWGENGSQQALGTQIVGEIVDMAKGQQTNFSTGEPLFYDDMRPRMQVAITLQTEHRGWSGVKPANIPTDDNDQPLGPEHDTGLRRIYVKNEMTSAVTKACAAAGQKPRKGGKLAVRLVGWKPTGKGNPMGLFEAQYQPAPEVQPTDSMFDLGGQLPQGANVVQGPPGGMPVQQAPQQIPAQQFAQQAPAQQQLPPGVNPSTLGQGQAPTQAPDFAQQPPAQAAPAQQAPDAAAAAVQAWQQQAPQQVAPQQAPPAYEAPAGQGFAPPPAAPQQAPATQGWAAPPSETGF